jgi:hypothetical protein
LETTPSTIQLIVRNPLVLTGLYFFLRVTWATRRLQAAEHYTSLAAQPPAYRQRLQRGRLARLDQRQQLVKARGVTRTLKPGACRLGGLVPPRER